jgi:gluconate 2-dehydrogenase gamma chain
MAATAAAGTGVACSRNQSPWRFLTVDDARTLAAISDQIIPPDQDFGASWAGVVNYIDRQLCEGVSWKILNLQIQKSRLGLEVFP